MSNVTDKEFVSMVVKSIVDHPDDVIVERNVDEMGVLITLQVNPEDMGYVIGKDGSTAKAIRTLLRIVGARNNARVNLKILEPEGGDAEQQYSEPTSTPSAMEEDTDDEEEEVV